jgi:hypothetical protein
MAFLYFFQHIKTAAKIEVVHGLGFHCKISKSVIL